MHRSHRSALPAALSLLVALHAPVARASGEALAVAPASAAAPADCGSLPGTAPERAPKLFDRGGFNFSSVLLAEKAAHPVDLCVLVDARGQVSDVRVSASSTPFDSAAADAVRWWWFTPARAAGKPVASWLRLSVDIQPPADTEAIVPDVLALAHDAESRGDVRGAIDAWGGVLARVGVHPSLGDEYSVRERILRLAARLPERPKVPTSAEGRARGARNMMQRNVARGENEDYAKRLDEALIVAPWYTEAYRWRAAARAACGMRAGALRDAACYRIAAPDSASRALADRAIALIAAGDTLTANSILKH